MTNDGDAPDDVFNDSGDGGGALIGDLLLCFLPGGSSASGAGDTDTGSSMMIDEFFSFSPLGDVWGDGVGDDGEYVGESGGGDQVGEDGVNGGPCWAGLTGDSGGGGHVGDDGVKGGP